MVHGKTPNCGRWDFFRHFRHVCLFFELRRRSYSANHPLSKAAQWLWIRLPRSRTRSSPLNPKSKRMTTRIGQSRTVALDTASEKPHAVKSGPNQTPKNRTIREGWFFSLVRQMGLEPIRLRTRTSNVPVCQFQHCRARCIIRCGFRIVNYYFALFRCFLNVRVRNS